jgi:hypothetical protein
MSGFLAFVLVSFFFAGAALVLHFLLNMLLPTLEQQGILTKNALCEVSHFRSGPEDSVSWQKSRRNSPLDCLLIKSLHRANLGRTDISAVLDRCVPLCGRLKVDFTEVLNSAPAQASAATGSPADNFCVLDAISPIPLKPVGVSVGTKMRIVFSKKLGVTKAGKKK